ncbi:MAG TPA: hypothetical protein VN577_20290 [Terriglobales bacterium]|nr:hypothetical protein [Terriglobales bacterium]
MTTQAAEAVGTIYVTLSGLPLFIDLKWPFRRASSGADFHVIHSDLRLADGSGLHALIAVNLSLTVAEVLPSLERRDTEAPVINALRKEVDNKQIEFMKSPKLIPVHFNSRYWSHKQSRWTFPSATDDQIAQLLLRKVYWSDRTSKGTKVTVADAIDAQYVSSTPEHLREVAQKLAAQDLLNLHGDLASAGTGLARHADAFEADMKAVLEQLQQKHAFERG